MAKKPPAKAALAKKPRATAPLKVMPKITASTLARSRVSTISGTTVVDAKPFGIAKPPPGVIPSGMAMDDTNLQTAATWATNYPGYAFNEGLEFLGYPYLAQLSQRPEYRRIVEVIATEATRKWIRLESAGDEDKSDKIKEIMTEMDRLGVQHTFKRLAEQDGFFGRSHLFIDIDDSFDKDDELKTPIGKGNDDVSKAKVKKNSLKAFRTVEAVWTYPTNYNSNNPLAGNWYRPDMWFVMGKQVHASRLLAFIGREVPDLLKPAYSFGGLALTQMAKPYVDNWLSTRQSVNDILQSFTVFVLATSMGADLQAEGGEAIFNRADLFNNLRNNRGLLMVDKDLEDFQNVSAPLGSLDALQGQSQEHMAAVSGIPLVKLLGIQPAGLNASSEGELRSFYDWIADYQNSLFMEPLKTVLWFTQMSLYGKVDDEITIAFEPLWALDETQRATTKKTEAETDQTYVDMGVIAPEEVRNRLANDPDSMYPGLDPDDMPDLLDEEEQGLEPEGGRPQPQATVGEQEEQPAPKPKRSAKKKPDAAEDSVPEADIIAWDEFNDADHPHAPAGGSTGGQFVSKGAGGGSATKAPPKTGSFNHAMQLISKLPKKEKQAVHKKMNHMLGNFSDEMSSGPKSFHNAMQALAGKSAFEKNVFVQALHGYLKEAGAAPGPTAEKMAQFEEGLKELTGLQSKAELELLMDNHPPGGFAGFSAANLKDLGFTLEDSAKGTDTDIGLKKGDYKLKINSTGKWTLVSPGHMTKTGLDPDGLKALLAGGDWQSKGVANYKDGGGYPLPAAETTAAPPKKNKGKFAVAQSPEVEAAKTATENDKAAAHATLKNIAAVRPQPNSQQDSAISSYKSSGYGAINAKLRQTGKMDATSAHIKTWLDQAALPEDCVVYRGVRGDYAKILRSLLVEGTTFMDRGFISTSTSKAFSASWASSSDGSLLFHVSAKKGQKGAAIRPSSHGDSEMEVVMQAGSKFHVTQFDFDTGIVHCEMLQD